MIDFKIKLEKFEGPLGLLYELIEKRKLQINTISLATITNEYLNYLKQNINLPIEQISSFIHTASILILIKSKSLLPILEYTQKEEVDLETLEKRLVLYKYLKEKVVVKLNNWKYKSFEIISYKIKKEVEFLPDKTSNPNNLYKIATDMVKELSYVKKLEEKKIQKIISIAEAMQTIKKRVENGAKISLQEIAQGDKKIYIVSFLGLLEMLKDSLLDFYQEKKFSNIYINKK